MRGGGPAFPFVWGGDLIGANIRLINIASRPELNGSSGQVVSAIGDTKRFLVRLQDKQEMSVTRSKLLRLCEGGWGDEYLGKTVTVNGLVKAAHLNGSQVCDWQLSCAQKYAMIAQGLVVGADASTHRIIVSFNGEGEEEGKEVALKPDNLKL